MITLTCEQCGQLYTAKPYMERLSEHHFCGLACYGVWQRAHSIGRGRKRVIVQCDACGKDIEKVPSAVAARNFCNRQCLGQWRSLHYSGENNAFWLGGHDGYRGSNWKAQSTKARARDNDTCCRCGFSAPGLHVHHITPFRLFDDFRRANHLDNLITLCPVCHGIEEQAFWKNHPEYAHLAPFPIVVPIKQCRACRQDFTPRSGYTQVCDNCCSATCAHCGQAFYTRKAAIGPVKYCSRECRNAAVAKDRTRICPGCGKVFTPDRDSTKFCSRHCHMTSANPRRQFSARRKPAAQASDHPVDNT